MFSYEFCGTFKNTFLKNTSGGLLLYIRRKQKAFDNYSNQYQYITWKLPPLKHFSLYFCYNILLSHSSFVLRVFKYTHFCYSSVITSRDFLHSLLPYACFSVSLWRSRIISLCFCCRWAYDIFLFLTVYDWPQLSVGLISCFPSFVLKQLSITGTMQPRFKAQIQSWFAWSCVCDFFPLIN